MRDLVDAFTATPGIDYGVGKVVSINATLGTVAIDWRGGRYSAVPYLLSYTPTVNDKVQVISGETIGALVLGKTSYIAPPALATARTDFIAPMQSMNWSENITNHLNGVATVTSYAEGLDEIDIAVKQGSLGVKLYSGAYIYPSNTIVFGSNEMLTRAEILISRIDEGPPMTVSPVLTELNAFRDDGKPIVDHPERSFAVRDMLPGDQFWVPMPLEWAKNLISHETLGIAFSATSAQLTLTYSEYAAATATVEVDSGALGGTIRLTIEDRAL